MALWRTGAAVAPVIVRRVRSAGAEQEEVLVGRAKQGDRAAFEELVRRNADRLYAVTLRFLADAEAAEDVTQEAFLRAWRGIGRFQGRSRFFTWLYRIAINEAKRLAGGKQAEVVSLDDEPIPEAPDWSEAPQARLEQSDLRRVLEAAVRELPIGYREPVILRDVEGLSTEEAAQVMALSEPAFKSRLHRARLAVRRSLDAYFLGERE